MLVICAIVYHVKRSFRSYALTTEKLRKVSGIFSRREDVIPLSRIQNATSASGFIQLLWGVGNILVESAGDRVGYIHLWSVDDPQGRTKQILDAARLKTTHHSPSGCAFRHFVRKKMRPHWSRGLILVQSAWTASGNEKTAEVLGGSTELTSLRFFGCCEALDIHR